MKIAVLIRVYDRIEDLKYNLKIIADTWTENEYFVIVVSNGKSKGYVVDESLYPYINKLVVLEANEGHLKGNSQLLKEGAKFIPANCDFTLVLEADTWLYGDSLISKYTKILTDSDIVWASADWYDKYISVATDFAIIKSDYIKKNPDLFDFGRFPECYVSNYMRDHQDKSISIEENMPVHVPSYVLKYPYVHNKERRFYAFPKSKMVTHHVEHLKNGMLQKKRYFNIISQSDYFEDASVKCKKWELFKIKFWINLSRFFLKRTWYSKKYYKTLDNQKD
ncbi:hypothetical protein D0T56_06100 [Dysgonomonas sp. 520]|nr:hypothetical protein [Dysgonomonas sp. 520]